MGALLHRKPVRNGFLAGVVLLFLISCSLIYFKAVTVKMLPFDNKNELQLIVDTPDGSTLEETSRLTAELGEALRMVPEVTDIEAHPHLAGIKVTICPTPEQYQALLTGGISCDDERITQ